jgi:hypothetical protein
VNESPSAAVAKLELAQLTESLKQRPSSGTRADSRELFDKYSFVELGSFTGIYKVGLS